MTKPSRFGVERPAGMRRVVVRAGRQRPDDVERAERERRLSGISHAAGDRRVDLARPDRAERLADRHRARWRRSSPSRGSGRGRRGRSRGWPAPRRRRPRGRGSGRPGGCPSPCIARAAPRRRRCRRARSRGRSRSAPATRRHPRPAAAPRPRGRAARSTSPNWLNRSSWRAVFGGIQASGSKSSTWAATWDRNGDGSKRSIRLTGDRAARRPARNAATPGADSRVMMPIPVIQTRRASSQWFAGVGLVDVAPRSSSLASASAIDLNVASVRDAIGWVNARSTNAAQPGTRGRKSWSIETRQPPSSGLDPPGHVHPVRGAAEVDEPEAERRLGSLHVRDRHATGRPSPRTRHQRPAGDHLGDQASRRRRAPPAAPRRSGGAAAASARRRGRGGTRDSGGAATSTEIVVLTARGPGRRA